MLLRPVHYELCLPRGSVTFLDITEGRSSRELRTPFRGFMLPFVSLPWGNLTEQESLTSGKELVMRHLPRVYEALDSNPSTG